jgi:hypothetical protein
MKFIRFSFITVLTTIAVQAAASVLPNLAQTETGLEKRIGISNTVKYSVGSRIISDYLTSRKLHTRDDD